MALFTSVEPRMAKDGGGGCSRNMCEGVVGAELLESKYFSGCAR